MAMIEFKDLVVSGGHGPILDGLSLNVERGEAFGLLGASGAGKSIALQVAATLIAPNKGTVSVAGNNVMSDPHAVRRMIGYMPQHPTFDENMRVASYLEFFAAGYNISAGDRKNAVADVLELTHLAPHAGALLRNLPPGLRHQCALARALVHNPEVLLLDDPLCHLDDACVATLCRIVDALRGLGRTIAVAGNVACRVEPLCSRIGILAHGRLIACGTRDGIIRESGLPRTIRIKTSSEDSRVEECLQRTSGIEGVRRDTAGISAYTHLDDAACAALLAELTAQRIPIVAFAVDPPSLGAAVTVLDADRDAP